MSFDEEDTLPTSTKSDDEKPKTFFGFEVGDTVTYGVVGLLTIIFVYQAAGVIALL
ncbi:MAG: hypothetical protein AB8B95_12465 [Pseudohongiellaceae bacterium]